jgi:phospholipid/cholesterol/gamma-HCH transport system substrate-binding protein
MRLGPRRSFRDMNPYAVGLASVGIIGALVGIAFLAGLLHLFEDSYTVRAVFTDAAGLRGGDEVRVAGVKAGRVAGMEVDRLRGHVVVTMEVDSSVELGPETEAEIALATLLGAKYVRLGGDVREPYLASLDDDDRTIPVERTKTPFEVFEVAGTGTRVIEETDNEKLNLFINQLADVTDGRREGIARLVRGIDEVATVVNDREQQLRSLLTEADRLTELLAEKDRTLVALVDESRTILRLLAERRADVESALAGGGLAAQEIARLLDANETRLQSVLDSLSPTLALLDRRNAELNATLAVAGPAQALQARAGSHGPWADIFVRALGPDVYAVLEQALGDENDGSGG